MNKYDGLARIILTNVGGKENVESLTHCVTRLRFVLKDVTKAHSDILESTDGVMRVIQSGGQYQIVIGQAVSDVYDAVVTVGKLKDIAAMEISDKKQEKLFNQFVGIVSSVFTPMVGTLCACGVMKGLLSAAVALGLLTKTDGFYVILFNAANAFYYFLPIVIAYNSAKKFKMNEIIALTVGMAMCVPALTNIAVNFEPLGTFLGQTYYLKFLGIPIVLPPNNSYAQTVIPSIAIIWIGSKLEKWLKQVIPQVVRTFLVPMCTIVILIPVLFIVVGPITSALSNGVSYLVTSAYSIAPWLEGMLLAGVHQILVIFGLHWSISPIRYNNLATLGFCSVTSANFVAAFSQTGACAAVMLKSRDARTRGLCAPSVVSGIFGVTEPAIYSINLPRKIPFVCGCIGSACAGFMVGFWKIKIFSAGMGLFALPNFINPENGDMSGMIQMALCVAISFCISFILTMMFYKPQDFKQNQEG